MNILASSAQNYLHHVIGLIVLQADRTLVSHLFKFFAQHRGRLNFHQALNAAASNVMMFFLTEHTRLGANPWLHWCFCKPPGPRIHAAEWRYHTLCSSSSVRPTSCEASIRSGDQQTLKQYKCHKFGLPRWLIQIKQHIANQWLRLAIICSFLELLGYRKNEFPYYFRKP